MLRRARATRPPSPRPGRPRRASAPAAGAGRAPPGWSGPAAPARRRRARPWCRSRRAASRPPRRSTPGDRWSWSCRSCRSPRPWSWPRAGCAEDRRRTSGPSPGADRRHEDLGQVDSVEPPLDDEGGRARPRAPRPRTRGRPTFAPGHAEEEAPGRDVDASRTRPRRPASRHRRGAGPRSRPPRRRTAGRDGRRGWGKRGNHRVRAYPRPRPRAGTGHGAGGPRVAAGRSGRPRSPGAGSRTGRSRRTAARRPRPRRRCEARRSRRR